MTRDKQRLADYLEHIIEAIERIMQLLFDVNDKSQPGPKTRLAGMP